MTLLDSDDSRPVHFVGVAGAGMSALAELFVMRGVKVTGCDASPGSIADLERVGVQVLGGHDPDHANHARALVVTSAMPKDHPELRRAKELGIPVVRRAEALGEAVSAGAVVGIAGTHGKTSTTVLTAEALASAGKEPTALVGGRVVAWDGNFRRGGDKLFIVEADEYDRSFLALTPNVAVVTNMEADHLDIYSGMDDIRDAFATFIRPARTIILCADDPGANSLRTPNTAEVIRYGITSPDARLQARQVRREGVRALFDVVYDRQILGTVELQLPGLHNVRNALAAIATGLALGATVDGMRVGLANVRGAERRFQMVGEAKGALIVDDYAHHPTEISATLEAARTAYPGRRLVVAFQPHLYSRTRDFATDFGRALAAADVVYLTEIYAAREKPIDGVTASLVAEALKREGGRLAWRGDRAALAGELASAVRDGDVVLTMGAGDITRTGPELLERLRTPA
jgi:UDP-N-acetylmuramate--alanine ligase